MNTFPALTASPDIASFVEDYSSEAVEIASYASGYPCINEHFTFDPMTWQYTLSNVSQTDKDTLLNFYQLNKGVSFYWENEQDSTVYDVIFVQQPSRRMQNNDDKSLWSISMVVRQASPTETPASNPVTTQFYGGPAMVEIEDLASGVSIVERPVLALGMSITITGMHILTKGTPEGIDNSNTVVITLKKNDGTTVVTKTYNTTTQPPTNGLGSLGTILSSLLGAAEWLEIDVTQTGTADMPAFALILEGYFNN
jgi:hypothetical protein